MADEPHGELVGIVDEYGTVWDGEPGVSNIIGDLVVRPDEETLELYLEGPAVGRRLREWLADEERRAAECLERAEPGRASSLEDQVEERRRAARHETTAKRIRDVLGQA